MSSTAFSHAESKKPTDGSWTSAKATQPSTTTKGQVFCFQVPSTKSALAKKHNKFAALISKLESNPDSAAALADSRQQIVETYYSDSPASLKMLRLKAGLSQDALAKAIESTQPHIANIENGKQNIMFETAEKMAKALSVSLDELFKVWVATRKQQ